MNSSCLSALNLLSLFPENFEHNELHAVHPNTFYWIQPVCYTSTQSHWFILAFLITPCQTAFQ